MATACVDRSWRISAVREGLTSSAPQVVLMLVVGVVLFVVGVTVTSAGGLVSLVGASLLTAGLVFPIASKASVGGSPFTLTFERDHVDRDAALRELDEVYGPTLRDVVDLLTGGDARSDAWIRQVYAQAFRDSLLVPRGRREVHVLCLLVRTVRGAVAMAGATTTPQPPVGEVGRLMRIGFDDRAAFVLHQRVQVDDDDGAAILHCTPSAFAASVARASEAIT